jgi:hypothetical protein
LRSGVFREKHIDPAAQFFSEKVSQAENRDGFVFLRLGPRAGG